MGTNKTPDNVRGFIVPFELDQTNYWKVQSNAPQGNQLAGIPESDTNPSLKIITRGNQQETIHIETIDGGHVTEGAKFGWRFDSDSDLYGHNVPNVLTSVDGITTWSNTTQAFTPRGALTTREGNIIIAVEHTTSTHNRIRITKVGLDGTAYIKVLSTVSISSLNNNNRHPAVVEMADGSILCMFYAINSNAETANVVVYRSTDQGSNWDLVSKRAIPSELDLTTQTLGRISVAATASQCVMFIEAIAISGTNRYLCYQYASVSQGLKFSLVGEAPSINTTYRVHNANVVAYNGVFVFSFIRNDDTVGVTNFTDAFDDLFTSLVFNNVTEIIGVDFSTMSANNGGGNKWMHIDVDGRLYIYAQLKVNRVIGCAYSDCAGIEASEYGRTWNLMGPKPTIANPQFQHSVVFNPENGGGVANLVSTFYMGKQMVFCNWAPIGTNSYQNSLVALTFGMWATQINPALVGYPSDAEYAHNTQDWAPSDLPDTGSEWTLTAANSPTIELSGSRLDISTLANQSAQYTHPISNNTEGATMHVSLDQVTGTSIGLGVYFGITIKQQSNATQGYRVRIFIGPTNLRIWDLYDGGSSVAYVNNLEFDGHNLYLHVDNATGDVTLYYADITGPRQYATLTATATLSNVSDEFYEWGATISIVGTTASWAYVSFSEYLEMGVGITNELNGKQYPAMGYYVGIDGGFSITTQDGPTRISDNWTIIPQYDRPIERVLYNLYPSKGTTWRSDKVADPDDDLIPTCNISWDLNPATTFTKQRMENTVIGIHLNNINFKTIKVYTYKPDSAAWVLHSTNQNQAGPTFAFSRVGNTIKATSTATNGPFFHYNECAGWYMILKNGNDQVIRKIRSNSEGVLDNNSNTRTAVFTLDDVTIQDPITGTEAMIVPNACTLILHDVKDLAGIRLTLDTQHTQQGYFEIGHMVMGPVVIPATQYGRGRTINWEADTQTIVGPNGVQYVNVKGNGGRTIRIAWQDGIDITDLYSDNPDPDYYTTRAGDDPEAANGSAPTTMMGIVQKMQGQRNAVVYLPNIDTTGTATSDVINRYHDHCMVTLGSDVQLENVIGDESVNEVLRVGTVVMREVR